MKTDHTFTFTAAVILAGVVLAFVNPADALDKAPTVENGITAPHNTFAALDSPSDAAAKHEGKHKGSCERAKRPERPANS